MLVVCEDTVTVVPGARLVIGPLRETLCGLPLALSVINSDPVLTPLVVGVKLTLIWQLAPATRLAGQLLAWAKSPLLGAMLVMFSALVPLLVSVTCCAVTVLPVPKVAKLSTEVESTAVCAGSTVAPKSNIKKICKIERFSLPILGLWKIAAFIWVFV